MAVDPSEEEEEDHLVLGFPPETGHLSRARRFVCGVVAPWGATSLDEVALVTTELVANAMIHAQSDVTLRVRRVGDIARVEVHDQSTELPQMQPPDPSRVGGQGLKIVDALARDWGVTSTTNRGKLVWFEFPIAR